MAKKQSRRESGSGSIRQRKDGLWEGRYTNGFDPKQCRQLKGNPTCTQKIFVKFITKTVDKSIKKMLCRN